MNGSVRGVFAAGSLVVAVVLAAFSVWLMVRGGESTVEVAGPSVVADEPGPLPGDSSVSEAIATLPPVPEPEQLTADSLSIPSLKIQAPIVPVTIANPDAVVREVPVPDDPATVGMSTAGAQPCAAEGTTLIVGHVSSHGVRGALWPLAGVTEGTELFVRCPAGDLATYRAVAVPATPTKARLDPGVDTASGPHRLVVVTCGGPVVKGRYRDNVVAIFTLESTR